MYKFLILILGVLPLYYGCGTAADSTNTLANLAGTWKTDCQGPTSSVYATDQLVISGSNMTETFKGFTDSTCTTNSTTTVVTYTLAVPGTTSSGSTKLNATVVSITNTPNTAAAATNYNTSTYCGFTNWANGVTKDITGNTTCSMKAAGAINYQTFSISTTSSPNYVTFSFFLLIGSSIYDFYDAWTSADGSQPSVFSATKYNKQ